MGSWFGVRSAACLEFLFHPCMDVHLQGTWEATKKQPLALVPCPVFPWWLPCWVACLPVISIAIWGCHKLLFVCPLQSTGLITTPLGPGLSKPGKKFRIQVEVSWTGLVSSRIQKEYSEGLTYLSCGALAVVLGQNTIVICFHLCPDVHLQGKGKETRCSCPSCFPVLPCPPLHDRAHQIPHLPACFVAILRCLCHQPRTDVAMAVTRAHLQWGQVSANPTKIE